MMLMISSMSIMSLNMKNMMMIPSSLIILFSINNIVQPQMMHSLVNLDNTSTLMITLTLATSLLIIMASSNKSTMFPLITTINTTLIMTFITPSLITFYVMFELSIIPTFMLIMMNGSQPERLKASMFLLMYTIFASIPLLMAISMIQPLSNMILMSLKISLPLPLMFIMAFLAKMPMYSLHLWLPKAHVEAPMEGSMILAAILLKLGSYGLFRMMPMMKKFTKTYSPIMMSISMIGCLLTPLMCTQQKDMKSMVAYSSVAHMSLIILSMFSMSPLGYSAAMLMNISHALTSSALFMMTTLTYSPFNSRNIHLFKGFTNFTPNKSLWWFLFLAANIGTPPFASLISEISSIINIMLWSLTPLIIMIMSGMLIATFSMYMYSQVNHNSPSSTYMFSPLNPSTELTLSIHLLPLIMILINSTSIMSY